MLSVDSVHVLHYNGKSTNVGATNDFETLQTVLPDSGCLLPRVHGGLPEEAYSHAT